jgi:membrane-associated phospholipid phosphatase
MRGLNGGKIIDWLPLPLIFFSYQLAGWSSRLLAIPLRDRELAEWDQRLFQMAPGVCLQECLPRAGLELLELFYFSYYLLVLMGPWLMYAREGRAGLWRLWVTVGLGYLICDLLFPWFPSTPPRLLGTEFAGGSLFRPANLWILDTFSIGDNVFPSSHVATGVTMAACHLRFHRLLGALFAVWALGITVSTVSGGYHYGVDAVGGVAVGLVAALAAVKITPWLESRSSVFSSRHNSE